MKKLRSLIFLIATLVIIVCVGLLVTNFDPNNPTQRRYSSERVLSTGEAPSDEIGRSGEDVLEKDLKFTRNDADIPVMVVCNSRYEGTVPPAKNTQCFYFSDAIDNYRVPDFVSDNLIAESKNVRDLLITQERNYQQIQAFALTAKDLNRPLYIYVRHDTRVDPEYHALFHDIDGGIVYYFRTNNHILDQTDVILLLVIISSLFVMVGWMFITKLMLFIMQRRPKPKSPVAISEHKTSRKARQSVNDYNQFMLDAKDNARRTLDDD